MHVILNNAHIVIINETEPPTLAFPLTVKLIVLLMEACYCSCKLLHYCSSIIIHIFLVKPSLAAILK